MISQTTGELEHRFLRHIVARKLRIAAPANFNAGEQIGFGPGQLEQACRFELRIRAKDFGVRGEGYAGPAPIGGRSQFVQPTLRMATLKTLAVQLLVARHFHHSVGRQCVDH